MFITGVEDDAVEDFDQEEDDESEFSEEEEEEIIEEEEESLLEIPENEDSRADGIGHDEEASRGNDEEDDDSEDEDEEEGDEEESEDDVNDDDSQERVEEGDTLETVEEGVSSEKSVDKKGTTSGVYADDDEEKWLEALEKGDLDDGGRLKKEQNKGMMTARQRALKGEALEGENDLKELPMYSEKSLEQNEEAERKKKLRARKRKQQMDRQIEEDKATTIDKLLRKGQQKEKKDKWGAKHVIDGPHVRYINNSQGISLSYSGDVNYPLPNISKPLPTITQVYCSVDGCSNIKKYSCSKTKLPVCSLTCYKAVQLTNVIPERIAS